MRKILLLLLIVSLPQVCMGQYRDSESLREKLKWDDEMLHIMLDTRFDLQYETGSGGDEFRFRGQSLRLWLEGEIIPGIRYRLRHRLNRSQTALSDGLSEATDHMWISFDLGREKQWTVTAGRQSVQLGTYEYDYNPADNYISTMVNSDFDNHKIGVNVAYRVWGQTFNLQVFNSDTPQFASEEYKDKAMAGSLLWSGSVLKGTLRTRTAYTVLQHSSSKYYHWFTTGIQMNSGRFTAEADYYLGNRNMDYGGVVGDLGLREVRDRSAAVNIKYKWEKWRPFIKGTWDSRHDKTAGSDAYQRLGIQAVMEYYPFVGHQYVSDLRFHIAYGFTSTSFKGQWSDEPNKDRHMIIAGMRWFFNAK